MGKNLPCPQNNSEPGPSPVGNRAPVSSVASESCSSTAREADCWIQLFGVSPVSPAKSDLSLPLAISGWRESTEGVCGSPLKPLQRITPTAFSGSALHPQAQLDCTESAPSSLSSPDCKSSQFLHTHQLFWGLPFPGNNDLIPKCNLRGSLGQIGTTASLEPQSIYGTVSTPTVE